jgi:geranylgeranyl diphosphate synthase type II
MGESMTPAATTGASRTPAATPRDRGVRDGPRPDAGKFLVPPANEERRRLVDAVARYVAANRVIAPLCRAELDAHADAIVAAEGLDRRVREFLLVLLHNAVWRDIVAAIPFGRRTLLLPPCLRNSRTCQATFDEFGLLCERCGACVLGALCSEAEDLGYAVLIAEGTTVVASLIEKGMVDAVIGVSCMPSLERAFSPVSANAVPGLAIPLILEGCKDTSTDVEWIRETMRLRGDGPAASAVPDLNRLHDEVKGWFAEEALRRAMRLTGTEIEEIAVGWLAKAGKRWRPFLTAGVYQALRGGAGPLPPKMRDACVAVECIHKASLIYDDIQDHDEQRYGERTVHDVHGVPVALTASLFLLGQGYRLIAECEAPAEERAAMVALATGGHCELCLGQGGELCWMREPRLLSPADVLDIFRLKTAPSFDVVFRLGAIGAGAPAAVHDVLKAYSHIVGIAYQIQDDLDDFSGHGDVDDVKSGRPSVIMALAHEHAEGPDRATIADFWLGKRTVDADEIRRLIERTGAEGRARDLLADHKERALRALTPLENRDLKILLHRIVAKVLKGG